MAGLINTVNPLDDIIAAKGKSLPGIVGVMQANNNAILRNMLDKQNSFGINPYFQAATGAMDLIGSGIDNLRIPEYLRKDYSHYNSLESLAANAGNTEYLNFERNNVFGNALSGAAKGAMAGNSFGPLGTAIGGGAGLLWNLGTSIFGNNRKKREEEKRYNLAFNDITGQALRIKNDGIYNSMWNDFACGGKAKKKKYGLGGYINTYWDGGELTNGGFFSNDVDVVSSGGTHEDNRYGGVPVSLDEQGVPNTVEEGEVIWNNYVFSNRISASEESLEAGNLNKSYKLKTFADIANDLQRESEERPFNSISRIGKEDGLTKLMIAQEIEKLKQQGEGVINDMSLNQFANGGVVDSTTKALSLQRNTDVNMFGDGGKLYSDEEIMDYLKKKFGERTQDALQVLVGEGGYDYKTGKFNVNARATNKMKDGRTNTDRGIFQISSVYHPNFDKYDDPFASIDYAYELSKSGTDWSRWVSYTKGNEVINAYRKSIGLPPIDSNNNNPNNPDNHDFITLADGTNVVIGPDGKPVSFLPAGYNKPAPENINPIPLRGVEDARLWGKYGNGNNEDGKDFKNNKGNGIGGVNKDISSMASERLKNSNTDWMIHAPVIGNGLAYLDTFTERPETIQYDRIHPKPLTERLNYEPVNDAYIADKLRNQYEGTRRGVFEATGGNRGLAQYGLMQNDRNVSDALYDAYIKGEEINRNRKAQVAGFNRQTSEFNSQADLQAQQFNTQLDVQEQQANAANRAALRSYRSEARSRLLTDISGLGKQLRWEALAPVLYGYDAYGKIKKQGV